MVKNKALSFWKYIVVILLVAVFSSSAVYAATPRYVFSLAKNQNNSWVVKPGQVITGQFSIQLLDDVEAKFQIGMKGISGHQLAQEGSGSILDMSTWMELGDDGIVEIDGASPGVDVVEIPFTVRIPDEISPGDYRAVVNNNYIDEKAFQEGVTGTGGARFTTAVGIMFVFSVPGERVHDLTFDSLEFGDFKRDPAGDIEGLTLRIGYGVKGNTVLTPRAEVTIRNLSGDVLAEKSVIFQSIFPGDAQERPVSIDELPDFWGWLDVEVNLKYNLANVFGQRNEEIFNVGEGSIRIYKIPWLQVLIGVILLGLVFIFIIYKFLTVGKLKKGAMSYEVKQGDTLQIVSNKFKVDPNDIIVLNKLKKPYFINPGEDILIPKKDEKKL